jgi:type VI secretion system protein ImpK
MSDARPLSMLACFADFYAEVAREKLACDERNAPPEQDPVATASAASNRLCAFLDRQRHSVRNLGTPVELDTYADLRMVMAAVADEAFLLDLPWRGRTAWLGVMLESRVCDSRSAGSHFFSYADRLIRADQRTDVARDAAAVLLMALQLGFQGRYRGAEGQRTLHNYRRKLYKLAGDGSVIAPPSHVFDEAYRYCAVLPERHTRGWITPLLRSALYAMGGYVVLSALLWLWLVTPFLHRTGMLPALS